MKAGGSGQAKRDWAGWIGRDRSCGRMRRQRRPNAKAHERGSVLRGRGIRTGPEFGGLRNSEGHGTREEDWKTIGEGEVTEGGGTDRKGPGSGPLKRAEAEPQKMQPTSRMFLRSWRAAGRRSRQMGLQTFWRPRSGQAVMPGGSGMGGSFRACGKWAGCPFESGGQGKMLPADSQKLWHAVPNGVGESQTLGSFSGSARAFLGIVTC